MANFYRQTAYCDHCESDDKRRCVEFGDEGIIPYERHSLMVCEECILAALAEMEAAKRAVEMRPR